MSKFIKEFRDFIVKGNALDLAVGIIIGAAFGAVVTSLVSDVLMPPLGYVMGGVDFADKGIQLAPEIKKGEIHPIWRTPAPKDLKPVILAYGKFINAMISLIIQGFAIFLVVKGINRLRRQPAPVPADPTTKECPRCMTNIPIKATRCPNCTSEL